MNDSVGAEEQSSFVEHTVRTTVVVPAWASPELVAEAMEILDPSLEPTGWRGARPGWGATTIYSAARRSA
jgi:hypothetical protein